MNKSKTLGVSNGLLAEMPSSPNAVSSQTASTDKLVDALPMCEGLVETKEKILLTLKAMGGNSIHREADNYVHSIFRSKIMRFKDDVEFFIDEPSRLVHFRSASRLGYSDFGANRKRYHAFKNLYQN